MLYWDAGALEPYKNWIDKSLDLLPLVWPSWRLYFEKKKQQQQTLLKNLYLN